MITTLALVLPLALDTFAISAALAMTGLPRRTLSQISACLVAFEAGMPLVGVLVGRGIGGTLGDAADYLAFAALAGIGIYLLRADDDEAQLVERLAGVRGWALIGLGIVVSLDELAIGFSAGLLHVPLAWMIALIACQALVATQLGMRLGRCVGEHMRERAERVAGLALLVLAAILGMQHVLS